MSILLSERSRPSLIVDIKADIAADSWGSKKIVDVVERAARLVLEYLNAEGLRRVPRYKKNVRTVLQIKPL